MSNWAALRREMAATTVDRAPAVARAPTRGKRAREDGRDESNARLRAANDDENARARRALGVVGARDVVVDARKGLLDERPGAMDERASEEARRVMGGAGDARTRARREASRLRAVSRLCATFERTCGKMLGKRWCSAFEEWLASAGTEAPLTPTGARCRATLEKKLTQSGAERGEVEAATAAMATAADECASMIESGASGGNAMIRVEDETDVVALGLGKTVVRLNADHFVKLRRLYELANGDAYDEQDFLLAAYAVVCRYDAAQGGQYRFAGGHHTALHGEVFDVLRDAFGVSCELFASPLNCRWPRYCSRYADVDRAFGSLGDYANFRPAVGSYEVNPPFDEDVVQTMAAHLFECLSSASGDLTFIVVTPHWPNRPCWELMRRSSFCTHVEVLSVRDAGYFEGAQHRKRSRYRRATSDTSVIFLQTTGASERNAVTEEKLGLLRAAFKPKPEAQKK